MEIILRPYTNWSVMHTELGMGFDAEFSIYYVGHERRRNIFNIFSHWLRRCSAIDGKGTHIVHKYSLTHYFCVYNMWHKWPSKDTAFWRLGGSFSKLGEPPKWVFVASVPFSRMQITFLLCSTVCDIHYVTTRHHRFIHISLAISHRYNLCAYVI